MAGAGTLELAGMASAAGVVVLVLLAVAPTTASGLSGTVDRIVCRVVSAIPGTGACPDGPTVAATEADGHEEGREVLERPRPSVRLLGAGAGSARETSAPTQPRGWCTRLQAFGSAIPGRLGQLCVGDGGGVSFCVTDPTGPGPCDPRIPGSFLGHCVSALRTGRGERICVIENGEGGEDSDRTLRCRRVKGRDVHRCTETRAGDADRPATPTVLPAQDAAWCEPLRTERGDDHDVYRWACADAGGNVYHCTREEPSGREWVASGASASTRCDSRTFPDAAEVGCAPPVAGVATCTLPVERHRMRCLIFDVGGPHVRGLPLHCRVAGRPLRITVDDRCRASTPRGRGLAGVDPPPGCAAQDPQIPYNAAVVVDPSGGTAFAGDQVAGGDNVILSTAAHQLHEAWLELAEIPGLPAGLHPPHVMIDPSLGPQALTVFTGPSGPVVVMATLDGAADAGVAAEIGLIHQLAPFLVGLVETNPSKPFASDATAVLTALTALLGQSWVPAANAPDPIGGALGATLDFASEQLQQWFPSRRIFAVALIRALRQLHDRPRPSNVPFKLNFDTVLAAVDVLIGQAHLPDPAALSAAVGDKLAEKLDGIGTSGDEALSDAAEDPPPDDPHDGL